MTDIRLNAKLISLPTNIPESSGPLCSKLRDIDSNNPASCCPINPANPHIISLVKFSQLIVGNYHELRFSLSSISDVLEKLLDFHYLISIGAIHNLYCCLKYPRIQLSRGQLVG